MSKSIPDLDTRIRETITPLLELEDEILVNAMIIYTAVGEHGENLYYLSTSGLPGWKVKGMISGLLEILEYD